MPVIRFNDAPRTENVQGRHIRHSAPKLGSHEILMGRTTKGPGPCAPYVHKHDHEDIIVMLRGSFTLRVGEEQVTLGEVAAMAGTNEYEILTRLRRVPRYYEGQ